MNISDVARRNGVSRGLLNVWRRKARQASSDGPLFVQLGIDDGVEARPGANDPPCVVARPVERIEVVIAGSDRARARRRRRRDAGVRAGGSEVDAVISFSPEVRVFVATQPIDFRKGVHGLVALVAEGLGGEPYSGDVFVFRSKRSDRLKLLVFDGSGLVLATKWLEDGGFCWPPVRGRGRCA